MTVLEAKVAILRAVMQQKPQFSDEQIMYIAELHNLDIKVPADQMRIGAKVLAANVEMIYQELA